MPLFWRLRGIRAKFCLLDLGEEDTGNNRAYQDGGKRDYTHQRGLEEPSQDKGSKAQGFGCSWAKQYNDASGHGSTKSFP